MILGNHVKYSNRKLQATNLEEFGRGNDIAEVLEESQECSLSNLSVNGLGNDSVEVTKESIPGKV